MESYTLNFIPLEAISYFMSTAALISITFLIALSPSVLPMLVDLEGNLGHPDR